MPWRDYALMPPLPAGRIRQEVGVAMRRAVIAILLATIGFAFFAGFQPSPAAAHCPGGFKLSHSTGSMNISVAANGIRADIEWTDPNVCNDSSSHWISLQKGLGWVQVGW